MRVYLSCKEHTGLRIWLYRVWVITPPLMVSDDDVSGSDLSDSLWLCLQPARLLCPWDFPDKNTGVGCHFLLHGVLSIQGSNPRLLHWQADSLPLSHQGSTKAMSKSWALCSFRSVSLSSLLITIAMNMPRRNFRKGNRNLRTFY